ncbi:hypothetical protein BCR44DRAFT_1500311 [Catenaria anguillulae PL171]|uniref:Ankyrin repeat-containing domain protein n=1 Tax=Catenaria anguillulae PL171 TaxID=765915 RepID=A0A1Y2HJ29_9FUNG|nr:hypothetical protein BCR44DRAFT_1500311 [Catenaria anguillulae PL171]
MSSRDSIPQLPFELVEPMLLTCIAALRHSQHVPGHLYSTGRITDRSADQTHLSGDLDIHAQVIACLCAVHPSPAMCASAARLSTLNTLTACKTGHVARLDKLHELGLCADPHGQALELAITNNHVSVLDWWIGRALPISEHMRFRLSVESALECGAFDAAKWVAEHRIRELARLSLDALEHPILQARVDVVHAWLDWKDAKLAGDFEFVLAAASMKGYLDIFKRIRTEHTGRFVEAVQEGTVLERVLVDASKLGDARVLQWWISVGLMYGVAARVERVAGKCIEVASEYGHVDVLCAWMRSQVPLEYTNLAMDLASSEGHVRVLEWWRESGLQLRYSEDAMTGAARHERYEVLEWWRESGLELKIDLSAVLMSAHERSDPGHEHDRVKFLNWWAASGMPLSPLPAGALDSALECGDAAILGWWERVMEREQREAGRAAEVSNLYSGRGVLHAIMSDAQVSLDWICRQKLDPKVSDADMEVACTKGVCARVVDLYARVGGQQPQCPAHVSHCPLKSSQTTR